jgi:hypothetical protein
MTFSEILGVCGFGMGIYNAVVAHKERKAKRDAESKASAASEKAQLKAKLRDRFKTHIGTEFRWQVMEEALQANLDRSEVSQICIDLMTDYNGNRVDSQEKVEAALKRFEAKARK